MRAFATDDRTYPRPTPFFICISPGSSSKVLGFFYPGSVHDFF